MNQALEKLKRLQQDSKRIKEEQGKNPRQWADEICQIQSREDRIKTLEKVPEQYRHWVKFYVTQYFMRKPRGK